MSDDGYRKKVDGERGVPREALDDLLRSRLAARNALRALSEYIPDAELEKLSKIFDFSAQMGAGYAVTDTDKKGMRDFAAELRALVKRIAGIEELPREQFISLMPIVNYCSAVEAIYRDDVRRSGPG